MTERAEDFYAALWTDLRRNRTDADSTDVNYLASEAEVQPFSASCVLLSDLSLTSDLWPLPTLGVP